MTSPNLLRSRAAIHARGNNQCQGIGHRAQSLRPGYVTLSSRSVRPPFSPPSTLRPSGLAGQSEQAQEQGRSQPYVPGSFHGQWCRCTLYLEQLSLPPMLFPRAKAGKAYKYYVVYKLPGAGAAHRCRAIVLAGMRLCCAVRTRQAGSQSWSGCMAGMCHKGV